MAVGIGSTMVFVGSFFEVSEVREIPRRLTVDSEHVRVASKQT